MVRFRIEQRCAFVTLNRPEKRNALNAELVEALQQAVDTAIADDSVRVIQLEGEGKVFCAGADLGALQAMRGYSRAENEADSRRLARLFTAVYQSPKPVIAAVRGAALAGGCGLATVCDITVAESGAKFGYTETRLGFVPAIVSVFAVRKMGEAAVRRLLLSAEIIDAAEAARIGLITEVAPEATFDARLLYWREALTAQVSGQAVAATKVLIQNAYTSGFDEAVEAAIHANVDARNSTDCRLGVDRFLAGEKNVW